MLHVGYPLAPILVLSEQIWMQGQSKQHTPSESEDEEEDSV